MHKPGVVRQRHQQSEPPSCAQRWRRSARPGPGPGPGSGPVPTCCCMIMSSVGDPMSALTLPAAAALAKRPALVMSWPVYLLGDLEGAGRDAHFTEGCV